MYVNPSPGVMLFDDHFSLMLRVVLEEGFYSRTYIDWTPQVLNLIVLEPLHVVGMLRFMSDINQPSLPTPLYAVLASISVFMALSTVFQSIISPVNSPFSDSALLVLSLPYWSFQLYVSL